MSSLKSAYSLARVVGSIAALAAVSPSSFASPLTADYGVATAAAFNTYDLGAGAALAHFNNDGTFSGTFQTMVDAHFLDASFVNVANLNSSFELTVAASFTGTYSSQPGNILTFSYTSGSVNVYLDTTPDYNFQTDSGFTDGTVILSGSVVGGTGLVANSFGFGSEQLSVQFTGYDPSVFSTPIASGIAQFNINLNNLGPLTGITSVLGQSVAGGVLADADGRIQLTTVPVPAAVWLFGSGLLGLLAGGKKRHFA